jgi:hypothetical protein
MLYKDTPYKVVQYLAKLSNEKVLPIAFKDENYIRHLIDRKAIEPNGKQFSITKKFEENFAGDIENAFSKCNSFIMKYDLSYLENHYSIDEIEALAKIEMDKLKIIEQDIAFQNILTLYFGSSKHKTAQSNLSKAIKTILGIEFFPEEIKDQQFISILYPKTKTRFIILCENKNRLITKRHEFIEYWYAGGKNIKQLEFIPEPQHPIFYLCDWDYDGLNIYIDIKRKYLPTLAAFIPSNPESLMIEQSKVRDHKSKWSSDKFLIHLNRTERSIAETLIKNKAIIVEQKILVTPENLLNNAIN